MQDERYLSASPVTVLRSQKVRQPPLESADEPSASFLRIVEVLIKDANQLEIQGRIAAALPVRRKILALATKELGGEHVAVASALLPLGRCLCGLGRWEESQTTLSQAREIYVAQLGPDDPHVAESLLVLSTLAGAQGEHSAAEMLLRQAQDIASRKLPAQHPLRNLVAANLASAIQLQDRTEEACRMFEMLIRDADEATRTIPGFVALTRPPLARCLAKLNRHAEAEWHLYQALEANHRQFPSGHPSSAHFLNDLGAIFFDAGQVERSAEAYGAAVHMSSSLATSNDLIWHVCRTNLAFCKWGQLRYEEAESLLREAATGFQRFRSGIAATGFGRTVPHVDAHPHYGLALLSARLGNSVAAWESAERFRGRGLLEDLDDRFGASSNPHPQLNNSDVVSLAELQSHLSADAAVIYWLDGSAKLPPEEDRHWAIVVRKHGEPRLFPLAGSGPNGSLARPDIELPTQLLTALVEQSPGWSDLAARIARIWFDPVRPALGADNGLPRAGRLVLLPGRLANLPCDLLLRPEDDFAVSYCPSATILVRLDERPGVAKDGGLLAFGDPIVERLDEDVVDVAATANVPGADVAWSALPHSRTEVQALAAMFTGVGMPVCALTGAEARQERLRTLADDGFLETFEYIHVASHAHIDCESPLNSGLLLSTPTLAEVRRAICDSRPLPSKVVTALEIRQDWRLQARLVSLSACSTARGRPSGTEGFLGFAQALLLAGARTVCLSLWPVHDAATSLLMQRFYQDILEGESRKGCRMPLSASLEEAKQWLRQLTRVEAEMLLEAYPTGRWRGKGAEMPQGDTISGLRSGASDELPFANPYFWAPFILIGSME